MDKLDLLLAAIGKDAVLDGQENRGVSRMRRILDYVALDVVEAQDGQFREVEPAIIKEAELVVDGAIHRCTQIKLRAQGSGERSLVNVEGVSALVGRH
jgi:hypothetical protein